KAGVLVDERKQGPGRHVETGEGSSQQPQGLAYEPIILVLLEGGVAVDDRSRIAASMQQPGPNVRIAGPQVEDGVVQLSGHLQRPPMAARIQDALESLRLRRVGRMDGQTEYAPPAVDVGCHVAITQLI